MSGRVAGGAGFVPLGVCQWCGVFGRVTKDHIKAKPERRELHALGWKKQHFPTVMACEHCNHKRGAKTVKEWQRYLLSELGWWYVSNRQFEARPMKAQRICTLEWADNGFHRCGAWMPCGVLRRSVTYVGMGLDVIASYIYQEPLEKRFPKRGGGWERAAA